MVGEERYHRAPSSPAIPSPTPLTAKPTTLTPTIWPSVPRKSQFAPLAYSLLFLSPLLPPPLPTLLAQFLSRRQPCSPPPRPSPPFLTEGRGRSSTTGPRGSGGACASTAPRHHDNLVVAGCLAISTASRPFLLPTASATSFASHVTRLGGPSTMETPRSSPRRGLGDAPFPRPRRKSRPTRGGAGAQRPTLKGLRSLRGLRASLWYGYDSVFNPQKSSILLQLLPADIPLPFSEALQDLK
ncbi:uncharacterized protein LOC106999500 [Macaca mulatta]